MLKIAIAGNTSLAYYCAQKLCRNGAPIEAVLIPRKGASEQYDAVDFSPLAGEFRIRQISIPLTKDSTELPSIDILIKLEWPDRLKIPLVPAVASLGVNLVGQYNSGQAFDIAAALYNGSSQFDLQLIGSFKEHNESSVIGQSAIAINIFDDVRSLKSKAAVIIARMLLENVASLAQAEPLVIAPVAPGIIKSTLDKAIDWNRDAAGIHNQVRSLTHPGQGAITEFEGSRLYVWHGHVYDLPGSIYGAAKPGTILDSIEELGVVVQTSKGAFLVTKIQPAGSPELPAWIWAYDYHIQTGDIFTNAGAMLITV
jgi:methionyl-tRNA formyltransferase